MKTQSEEKQKIEEFLKLYINDIDFKIFKDNSRLTTAFINLSIQFNSALTGIVELEDNNKYYYNRINVK